MKKYISFFIILIYCSCNDNNTPEKITDNKFYDNAWKFYEDGKDLDAFINFGKAKDVYLKNKDSLSVAKCLTNMASILYAKGDNFGSIEVSLDAIKFLNEKNKKHFYFLLSNFNNLGLTNYNLKDYSKSLHFYDKALNFCEDLGSKQITLNNKANSYREFKKYNKALEIYNYTLKLVKNDESNYARTLTNLAFTKWLQNPKSNPIPEFQKALKIRLKERDNWGLNSSYAHIADYYLKSNPDSALIYSKKMLNIAKQLNSPDDQVEALQKLIVLDPRNYSSYFNRYQSLNDSLQTARNKAKNQFALIRYETEKNKADFLKAKAESTQRQNYIIKQYVIIGIVILALILYTISFRKRQKRLQQEKLLEVKNTELKYSKKVHDRVANRIYQLMSQVENKESVDKDALLFGLENAYETSRDISYDKKDIHENQYFSDQLQNIFDSYSSGAVKCVSKGNTEKMWEGVSFQNKTEVYLVLQELMTNMKKHSCASFVSLIFSRVNERINISYTDNGVGIKEISPKNGLQNMENRINAINGTIIFDTETNNLLKINISIPV